MLLMLQPLYHPRNIKTKIHTKWHSKFIKAKNTTDKVAKGNQIVSNNPFQGTELNQSLPKLIKCYVDFITQCKQDHFKSLQGYQLHIKIRKQTLQIHRAF